MLLTGHIPSDSAQCFHQGIGRVGERAALRGFDMADDDPYMTDRDRAEMRELCNLFRQATRERGLILFDQDAQQRIGQMIARRRAGTGRISGICRSESFSLHKFKISAESKQLSSFVCRYGDSYRRLI